MKFAQRIRLFLLVCMCGISCSHESNSNASRFNLDNLIIRIAEIEIDSAHVEENVAILKEEAAASVKLEEGVLCIYPMYQTEKPTEIRLLEIYADNEAYQSHLKTPHFLQYKTTTGNMVKSLKLIDMEAIDTETMNAIFRKLGP